MTQTPTNKAVREALEDIARQKLTSEMERNEDGELPGDIEHGYDCIIKVGRDALALLEAKTAGVGGDLVKCKNCEADNSPQFTHCIRCGLWPYGVDYTKGLDDPKRNIDGPSIFSAPAEPVSVLIALSDIAEAIETEGDPMAAVMKHKAAVERAYKCVINGRTAEPEAEGDADCHVCRGKGSIPAPFHSEQYCPECSVTLPHSSKELIEDLRRRRGMGNDN